MIRPEPAAYLAAKTARNYYYDNIYKVRSIAELRALIGSVEQTCAQYKINPDFIFWTNEKFASSKPEDYIIV